MIRRLFGLLMFSMFFGLWLTGITLALLWPLVKLIIVILGIKFIINLFKPRSNIV